MRQDPIPAIALQRLLEEDGIKLPSSGGAEKYIRCFSAAHNDSNPSMAVNVATGVYLCHGCGLKGNTITYLTEIRGLSPKEAGTLLEERFGWNRDQIMATHRRHVDTSPSAAPMHTDSLPSDLNVRGDIYTRIADYDYHGPDGELLGRVSRFQGPTEEVDGKPLKPKKQMRQYTPRTEGGWWVCGPLNKNLPESERRIKKYPLYRLPGVIKAVESGEQPQIWIVEGEKCADAVATMTDAPESGPPPVTSLWGGSKDPRKTDLRILARQNVLLVADADDVSRKFMRTLGSVLSKMGCAVRVLFPEGDDGHDVADVLAGGRGWPDVLEWAQKHGVLSWEEVKDPDAPPLLEAMPPLAATEHFRVLGFQDNQLVVQDLKAYRFHRQRDTAVANAGFLMTIAPLAWWEEQIGQALTSRTALVVGESLLRAADEMGMSDAMQHVYGRGALRTRGRKYIFNTGRSLLTEGSDGKLDQVHGLGDEVTKGTAWFEAGPEIIIKSRQDYDEETVQSWGWELCDALYGYRFSDVTESQVFAGWLVTSLIGGALPHRPMVWLHAEAETGKTFLLEQVASPVLGNTLTEVGAATEAGIAHATKNEALAVYIDEFEPEAGRAVERFENIMKLIRTASAGSAGRIRGGMDASYFRPRFSILVASIARPNLSVADESRFVRITLSSQGVQNWRLVKRDLLKATGEDRTQALRSWIVHNTPAIVEEALKIEDDYLETIGGSTRQAQIYSALTAGYRFLTGGREWTIPYLGRSLSDVKEDKYNCLKQLLGTRIQSSEGSRITLAKALTEAFYDDGGGWYPVTLRPVTMQTLCKTHGALLGEDGSLWLAPRNPELRSLLARTSWANMNLEEYLKSLPGAGYLKRGPSYVRIKFSGAQHAVVAIPPQTLDEAHISFNPREEG